MNLLPALVVAVSLSIYIVSGFPLKPGGLPELAPEVEFLDHLANMVVAINMSAIPSNLRNLLPRYHLLNCVTPEQREVITYCHNTVAATVLHNFEVFATNRQKLNGSLAFLPPPPEVAAECILNQMGALTADASGKLGVDNASRISSLKKTVVDRSSLSAEQKRAATATLDTCMSTNMTLPSLPIPPPHNHHPPPPSTDEINTLMNGNLNMSNNSTTIHPLVVLKLVLCSAKALIQNGCANSNKTLAALITEPTKVLIHRHVWEIEEDLVGSNGAVMNQSVKKVLHREEWQEGKPDSKSGVNGSNPVQSNATVINKPTMVNTSNNSNMSAATVNSTITVIATTNPPSNTNTSTTSTVSPKPSSSAPLVDAGSMNASTTTTIRSISTSTSTALPTTLIVTSNTTTSTTNKSTVSSTTTPASTPGSTTTVKSPSSPLTLAPRPPSPPPTVYGQDLLPVV